MSWRLSTVFGALAGIGLALLALILLAFPSPAPAQKAPAAATAEPPPGYAGGEICKGFHADQFEKFSHIASGAWLLDPVRVTAARTDRSAFSAVAEETTT